MSLSADKVTPARNLFAPGIVEYGGIRSNVVPDIALSPVEGEAASPAVNFICEYQNRLSRVEYAAWRYSLLVCNRLHGRLVQGLLRRAVSPVYLAARDIGRFGRLRISREPVNLRLRRIL